ncbi:MAG: DUF6918 family protein [Myxococcota bacterium]
MATLAEVLLNPSNRPKVIRDCVGVLEGEVDRKGGLSGIAIKTGFKVLKTVKPTMVEDSMDGLLDEFVEKLEPIHTEYMTHHKGTPLDGFLGKNASRIANVLLGITDVRAQRSTHSVVKGTYEKLRPTAAKHIEEAMPAVARLLRKHMGY